MANKFYPTIGMEVHVELKTKSKMFCSCPADHFAKQPNTQTCPVCLGLPGTLPVPNQQAVDWTILIGLALNCSINSVSEFDRKHYFYPDLPKGYQISQNDKPISHDGWLTLENGKRVLIRRAHLEEDTAKMIHKKVNGQDVTLVDFNRSGVPLVEIVTQPMITSGAEAKEYLKKLRDIIRALDVSDCDMEKGSMRLEANISLTLDPKKLANYKVEVKNLNSFRFVEQAINFEIERQTKLLQQGIIPEQETRGYDDINKRTYSQRHKETAENYRYFTDPDIPPMIFSKEKIKAIKAQLPKLPEQLAEELVNNFHLNIFTARLLARDKRKQAYFYKYKQDLNPVKLANMIVNKKIDLTKPPPINQATGKVDPQLVSEVIKNNQAVVAKYKAGKTEILGFLIGQIMRLTKGKINPQQARQELINQLR